MSTYRSYINYSSLPQNIKDIGDECFGAFFLKNLFQYGIDYYLVIKIDNGYTIGFSIYHLQDSVGIIDCLCVSPKYQGEGYGSDLLFQTIKKIGNVPGIKTVTLKDKKLENDNCSINRVFFDRIGFRIIGEKQVNNANKIVCNYCNNFPDTCTEVIYSIKI